MARRLRLSAEDELTGWLRRRMPGGELLGDDAAYLTTTGDIAITVDQQIAGTHFPIDLDPACLGPRLLEVTLSDLAACGARPRWVFLAIAAPEGWRHRRFFEALGRACGRREVELAGGDLAAADRVGLSLTAIGDRPARGRFVRRSTARPGDRLWVAGELGMSALGRHLVAAGARPEGRSIRLPPGLLPSAPATPGRPLRTTCRAVHRAARRAVRAHLAPRARLAEGEWLGRRHRAAAIDISDGLALDLARLCAESRVGAHLDPEAIRIAASLLPTVGHLGLDPLDLVLAGGEDYALVAALPPSVQPPTDLDFRPLGRVVSGSGLRFQGSDRRIEPSGWSHLQGVRG